MTSPPYRPPQSHNPDSNAANPSRVLRSSNRCITPTGVIKFIIAGLILYIGLLILTPFPHYLPPDFEYGFLRNKANFFYSGGYFIGFYAHIFSAPIGLLIGTPQMSKQLRQRFPNAHRRLGTAYAILALLAIAPGGLIMATRAYGGLSTMFCFGLISALMWTTTLLGWQAANRSKWAAHGRWMCRSYTLLCSAIMLRLINFALSRFELDHTLTYQLSAWFSWLPAVLCLEIVFVVNRRRRRNRKHTLTSLR